LLMDTWYTIRDVYKIQRKFALRLRMTDRFLNVRMFQSLKRSNRTVVISSIWVFYLYFNGMWWPLQRDKMPAGIWSYNWYFLRLKRIIVGIKSTIIVFSNKCRFLNTFTKEGLVTVEGKLFVCWRIQLLWI
jgi:hypothetical protein